MNVLNRLAVINKLIEKLNALLEWIHCSCVSCTKLRNVIKRKCVIVKPQKGEYFYFNFNWKFLIFLGQTIRQVIVQIIRIVLNRKCYSLLKRVKYTCVESCGTRSQMLISQINSKTWIEWVHKQWSVKLSTDIHWRFKVSVSVHRFAMGTAEHVFN